MYNLTILSFVPNQSERRLNLNARPRRELRANEVIRVIFNLFNSCPCTCCVCTEWAESSAAKAQCEYIHVLYQWRTFHSARALCSHSKHQHSLYIYIYEYVRVRGTTLSWWMDGECCANSRSCEPKKSNRAGSAARSECVCVWVSWCWWMKNRSTSDLSYTSPAPRAACAHRRQEFLIKSPTVTNHVAAVQHFCLFYDFTQAARER